MVGISGAATVSMGLIALPSMLKRNYDKSIALGCVAAGGALGILIPPSTVMIMLALFGNLSVGKLFLGGVLPGLLLSALYIIYIVIRCKFNPQLCPPVPDEEILSLKQKLLLTKSLILPVSIILIVLGTIFTGAATPTEAAGVGAIASILAAAINKRLTFRNFLEACQGTLKLSGMVMWIILGAGSFTALYSAVGAQPVIESILLSIPGGAWGTIIGMQLILFILGMILDPSGIIMITTGLFVPLVVKLGFDPLWYGVLFVVNMEMAYLTPPVGFNLFYMKAIAPDGVTMKDIYVSIIPFVLLQALGLILCMIFPQICLWLPNTFLK
jgi:tripartite ATP-independent transporter DctM subunit